MVVKKVIMAVDPKFYDNIFDKERRRMQKKIGVDNLSCIKFTRMIKGFKIREPKQDLSQVNTTIRRQNVKI